MAWLRSSRHSSLVLPCSRGSCRRVRLRWWLVPTDPVDMGDVVELLMKAEDLGLPQPELRFQREPPLPSASTRFPRATGSASGRPPKTSGDAPARGSSGRAHRWADRVSSLHRSGGPRRRHADARRAQRNRRWAAARGAAPQRCFLASVASKHPRRDGYSRRGPSHLTTRTKHLRSSKRLMSARSRPWMRALICQISNVCLPPRGRFRRSSRRARCVAR